MPKRKEIKVKDRNRCYTNVMAVTCWLRVRIGFVTAVTPHLRVAGLDASEYIRYNSLFETRIEVIQDALER